MISGSETKQGSHDWLMSRVGKISASRMADVMAKTKTGYGAARERYASQLIAERISNKPVSQFISAAMQHGIDTEKEAREFYEGFYDCEVKQVGFIEHPTMVYAGASPDGLVGDDGLLEIKCPETTTYFDVILYDSPPDKYVLQCQWQMACTNTSWCDLMFYDNRVPDEYAHKVFRIYRDEARIEQLEREVENFNDEINRRIGVIDQNLSVITNVGEP